MKVALITPEYEPYVLGGAGISASLLVRELRRRGIFVDVHVFSDFQHPVCESDGGSARYYHVVNRDKMWPLLDLEVVSRLWKHLNKYDLVHVYPFVMGALGFLRKATLKAPVVATLNGEEPACINIERWTELDGRPCNAVQTIHCALERAKRTEMVSVPGPMLAGYFVLQRALAQKLDRYFALSEVMKRLYVSHGFPNDRMRVIPNMFDPEFAARLQHVNVEKSRDKTIVLYVGRLARWKGVDSLIDAFSALRSAETELWIVGTGPEETKLRSMARKSERQRDIRFLGYMKYDDLASVYKKSHIFVHTLRRGYVEPFGRTLLEAMLSELAIVASDGVSPEVLGDTGLIYHDESELTRKMKILISDGQMRRKLGESACRKAREDFSPEAICERIIAEYRDVSENCSHS